MRLRNIHDNMYTFITSYLSFLFQNRYYLLVLVRIAAVPMWWSLMSTELLFHGLSSSIIVEYQAVYDLINSWSLYYINHIIRYFIANVDSTIELKAFHYNDVIMSTMASQITSLTIVYLSVYSGADKKTSKPRITGLCEGNSPVTDEFPAQ